MRVIGFLVFPGFQLLDLSGPLAAFEVAGKLVGGATYQLHVMSVAGGMVKASCGVEIGTAPFTGEIFDTLLVPGGAPCLAEVDPRLASILKSAAPRCRRVASVCTGAFMLAEAGPRGAPRHDPLAPCLDLRQRFPRIRVDAEPLFVQDERSDGDRHECRHRPGLAMIEGTRRIRRPSDGANDGGPSASALEANRSSLVPQRSSRGRPVSARCWTTRGLTSTSGCRSKISAEIACLSPRQFSRVFTAEMGRSPAKVLEHLRAEAARLRIETSSDPIELISRRVGFDDPERMRRTFIRIFGQPPQSVRRAARAA